MATRVDIVERARDWLDVRWQHQGRTRHGVDCVGLIAVVALDLGLIAELPPPNYPRRPNGSFLTRFRETALSEIRPADANMGDVVVFTAVTNQCHCGILADREGRRTVIHAHAGGRKVREECLSDIPSTVGIVSHAFEMPGLAES